MHGKKEVTSFATYSAGKETNLKSQRRPGGKRRTGLGGCQEEIVGTYKGEKEIPRSRTKDGSPTSNGGGNSGYRREIPPARPAGMRSGSRGPLKKKPISILCVYKAKIGVLEREERPNFPQEKDCLQGGVKQSSITTRWVRGEASDLPKLQGTSMDQI